MNISSDDLVDGAAIDPMLAFGCKKIGEHMALSSNLNPQLAWDQAPEGCRSFAVTCIDPDVPAGSRQGLNDYTAFMAGSEMAGDYFGYDGPCPPWNDERLHHYGIYGLCS